MKYLGFENYFKPSKSEGKYRSGIHQSEKRHGRIVWESGKAWGKVNKGTYIRAIHGELK